MPEVIRMFCDHGEYNVTNPPGCTVCDELNPNNWEGGNPVQETIKSLTQEQIEEFKNRVSAWAYGHARLWTGYEAETGRSSSAHPNGSSVPKESFDKNFDSEDI